MLNYNQYVDAIVWYSTNNQSPCRCLYSRKCSFGSRVLYCHQSLGARRDNWNQFEIMSWGSSRFSRLYKWGSSMSYSCVSMEMYMYVYIFISFSDCFIQVTLKFPKVGININFKSVYFHALFYLMTKCFRVPNSLSFQCRQMKCKQVTYRNTPKPPHCDFWGLHWTRYQYVV